MSHKKTIIKKVYRDIPSIRCKGLCHHQCTVIGYTEVERRMMTAAGGKAPSFDTDRMRCNYLTEDNRCSIYNARPFVCRIYGVSKDLVCPHGCKPNNGKYIDEDTENEMNTAIAHYGGAQCFNATPEDFENFLCNAPDVDIPSSK